MTLGRNSSGVNVYDYFVSPINNQTAVKGLIGEKQYSYSGGISLNKYLSEKAIKDMVNINSEISSIMNRLNVSVKINMSVLENLVKNHLPETRNIAFGIADCLPKHLKREVNRSALSKAAVLHDIAKVIMPENIVNKAGALSKEERKIMEKHAVLSYEMLKSTDLDEITLNLIKNHHYHGQNDDINLQILSMADIYSALREKRSYKAEMSKETALKIISEETENGKFHPSVYKALIDYVNRKESSKIASAYKNFVTNIRNCINAEQNSEKIISLLQA